jgi:thiamine-phosphate diphosphorylase
VREIVRLASGTPTKVIVNDRLDVALAGGAGGVHLRSRSVSAGVVRSVAPRDFLIGRSVHSIDEAVAAAPDVDYLIAGAVWPSRSKPAGHAVLGIAGLAAVAAAVSVPVLAIGGVTLEHLPQLRTSGAAGAAAIGLFMTSADESAADGCRACPLETVVASARAV